MSVASRFDIDNQLEVERLRLQCAALKDELRGRADIEDKLRSLNAELVAALEEVLSSLEHLPEGAWTDDIYCRQTIRAALAKVKEGK